MALKLEAKKRSKTGKSNNRILREQAEIPAVVYGRETENKNLTVRQPELRSLLKTGALSNVIVELDVEGESEPRNVLIKEVDIHPVESGIQHVDFHQVSPDDRVQVKIPVQTTGQSVGVEQEGGILIQAVREILVDCKASDIPEQLEVDIEEMDIGDVLFVRDIPTSGSVEILSDEDRTLVSIQPPKEYDLEPTVPEIGDEIDETVEDALEEAAEDLEEDEIEGEEAAEEGEETVEGAEGEPEIG